MEELTGIDVIMNRLVEIVTLCHGKAKGNIATTKQRKLGSIP